MNLRIALLQLLPGDTPGKQLETGLHQGERNGREYCAHEVMGNNYRHPQTYGCLVK